MSLSSFFVTLFVPGILFANADLKAAFEKIDSTSKGPFGLNYLQGSSGKTTVKSGASPSGQFQFQAAYRNDDAVALIDGFQFYTGNLFTTNYYELMGEYVYSGPRSNHGLDHSALLSQPEAMVKATTMVQHWVLEKYYLETYTSSTLARAFATRGISGSEFEQEYANYFLNFYFSSITTDYQFLPGFLLAQKSPIFDSSELAESRRLIAESFDYFAKIFSSSDQRLVDLRTLRNMIHNQLSEDVLSRIDLYLAENPWYAKEGNTYLQRIHRLLTTYYSFNTTNLASLAQKENFLDLQAAAESIEAVGVTAEGLLSLSVVAANYKTDIATGGGLVPFAQKAVAVDVLSKTCRYISKEISRMDKVEDKKLVLALLNVIYAEGFLIFDNWQYYKGEFEIAEISVAKEMMKEVVEVATMTLEESFIGPYGQWVSIAPDAKMQNFIDSTIKASSLNTASMSITK